jgi:Glucodextranase, domain B
MERARRSRRPHTGARGASRYTVPVLLAVVVLAALAVLRIVDDGPEDGGADGNGAPATGAGGPPSPTAHDAPSAEITWPAEGSAHATVRLPVRGTARGLDAVYVNSDRCPVAADGTWTDDLELSQGEAEIRVRAPPEEGSDAPPPELALVHVTIDLTAPVMQLTELPGSEHPAHPHARIVGAAAQLVGTLEDPWPGGVVELTLDGRPVPFEPGSFRVPLALQKDGEHTAELVARDAAGNKARLHVPLVRDTKPPAIAIRERTPRAGGGVLVRGTVEDEHPARLLADGKPVALDPEGGFELELEAGSAGAHLVAEDAAGNRSDEVVVEP